MVAIYRGEDTDFAGAEPIIIKIDTELDLTGFTAEILFGSVVKEFGEEDVAKKILPLSFTAEETSGFFPGRGYATVKVYDTEGRVAILKRFVIDVRFRDEKRISDVDFGAAISVLDSIKDLVERLEELIKEDDSDKITETINEILVAARKRTEFIPVTRYEQLYVGTEKAFRFVESIKRLEAIAINVKSVTDERDLTEIKEAIKSIVDILKKN